MWSVGMTARWLSIVGIGEDGQAGLSHAAMTLIDNADLVIGGRRHLDLIGTTRAEQRDWPVPLEAIVPEIIAHRGRPVCVLASGDPFWFGVGVTLTRHIPVKEMLVVPAPSSFSLAASRLGWALQTTVTLGLNLPNTAPLIARHLHHGQRILALAMDATTPQQVANLLTSHGFGASQLWVLEALGGPREAMRETTAAAFDLSNINPLNIIAVEVAAGPDARSIPFAAGLPDDYFEHDGQITKGEIRAVTLSSLTPAPGQLLWDVGLGSGSVAIEWLLSHVTTRAIGFERDEERASRAIMNAIRLGVPHLKVQRGATPAMFKDVESPDAIFIGGGATAPGVFEACWRALKPGGRIVINAVTLETEALVLRAFDQHGGSLTRISIDRAVKIGGKHGWRPAMPITHWVGHKP
jgi:precorrin-6B C5,15-methyltransferase / cobalt-precorrin-6B C5,C15-methyltransferase